MTQINNYGLRVFTADGGIRVDLSDRAMSLVYSKLLANNSTSSATIAVLAGKNSVQFAVGYGSRYPHHVYRGTGANINTIYWEDPSGFGTPGDKDALLLVFTYD